MPMVKHNIVCRTDSALTRFCRNMDTKGRQTGQQNAMEHGEGHYPLETCLCWKVNRSRFDHCAQLSARRQGKVMAYDAASGQVSLEPWPRPGFHPVWTERAQAEGMDYYEYLAALEEAGEGALLAFWSAAGVLA